MHYIDCFVLTRQPVSIVCGQYGEGWLGPNLDKSVLCTLIHWSLRNEIESSFYMASYRVLKTNFIKDCIDKSEYIKIGQI